MKQLLTGFIVFLIIIVFIMGEFNSVFCAIHDRHVTGESQVLIYYNKFLIASMVYNYNKRNIKIKI